MGNISLPFMGAPSSEEDVVQGILGVIVKGGKLWKH